MQLCRSYLKGGFCPYGRRCHFAHGVNDPLAPSLAMQHLPTQLSQLWPQARSFSQRLGQVHANLASTPSDERTPVHEGGDESSLHGNSQMDFDFYYSTPHLHKKKNTHAHCAFSTCPVRAIQAGHTTLQHCGVRCRPSSIPAACTPLDTSEASSNCSDTPWQPCHVPQADSTQAQVNVWPWPADHGVHAAKGPPDVMAVPGSAGHSDC